MILLEVARWDLRSEDLLLKKLEAFRIWSETSHSHVNCLLILLVRALFGLGLLLDCSLILELVVTVVHAG